VLVADGIGCNRACGRSPAAGAAGGRPIPTLQQEPMNSPAHCAPLRASSARFQRLGLVAVAAAELLAGCGSMPPATI
jgi:hypothetical protein